MNETLTDVRDALANSERVAAALLEKVKNGEDTDLKPLILNADFSARGTGWTQEPAFTQADKFVAEYYNTTFDFSQVIGPLPAGTYELSVQSFYREGDINTAH